MPPASFDQDRDRPAPLLDRGRKLGNLLVAVGARIARIGDKLGDRPALNLVGGP